MALAKAVQDSLASSSMIRKMFEEGLQLKKQHGADKVFDFSLGNPDIDPPKEFHDVFVKFAQEDEKGSHGYMPNAGYMNVREALAKKVCREQNVNIDGCCIIMAAGAAGGLNTVFKAVCNPGDEVIVTKPFFVEYRAYAANHQVKLVEVEAKEDFDLDLSAIGAALNEKTAAVLINSPNNPTGKVYDASSLAALASLLEERGKKGRTVYLVSDEPYREIAYNVEVPPFLCCYKESIVVSSYSKNLSLPGERIGYIAVNPEISGREDILNGLIYCARVLGFVNAPALMQRIVAQLTEARVDVGIYERRRDAFMKVLDAAGIKYAVPQGAFYLFCQVPPKKSGATATDAEFVEHLKKYLILGVPGTGFGKSGWLRFAYCIDEKIISASGDAFKKAMADW
uniref:Aminotransferase n=1 Tax=uncultured bacterium contig00077 TaxID=1181555 RepID=A0A806JZV0_9BACT|nr:biosynthetic Aromatic amino acid aminotransferase alpha @ aspartate aminotransferase [uncultured bacterium contig00077]